MDRPLKRRLNSSALQRNKSKVRKIRAGKKKRLNDKAVYPGGREKIVSCRRRQERR